MKSVLGLCFFVLATSANAQSLTFDNYDLQKIDSSMNSLASGMGANVTLSKAKASCRANTMHQLPGYQCVLKSSVNSSVSLSLTNSDIDSIYNTARQVHSGGLVQILTQSQKKVVCRSNTMASLPGFTCGI